MLQHLLRAGFVRSLRETPLQRFHSIIIGNVERGGDSVCRLGVWRSSLSSLLLTFMVAWYRRKLYDHHQEVEPVLGPVGKIDGDRVYFTRSVKVREGDPGENGIFGWNGARNFIAYKGVAKPEKPKKPKKTR